MDKTSKKGSQTIDSIAASEGVMEYVEGSKLLDFNDIVFTDHRRYITDVNIEEYFGTQLSNYDKINHVVLNPSRRSH